MYNNTENSKKNFQKSRRNMNSIVPNPASKKRFIPNPYGLKVVIEPKPDGFDIKNLDMHIPFERFPFIVVRRGYMKTLQNMLNDFIDFAIYDKYGVKSFQAKPIMTRKEEIKEFFKSVSLKFQFLPGHMPPFQAEYIGVAEMLLYEHKYIIDVFYKEWKEFCKILDPSGSAKIYDDQSFNDDIKRYMAANKEKLKSSEEADMVYGLFAEQIYYYPNSFNTEYQMDTSYIILPKYMAIDLSMLFTAILETFGKLHVTTVHQIAAVSYLSRCANISGFILE